MGIIGQIWRGERSLAFTFWVMGVLVSIPFRIWDTTAADTAFSGYEITHTDVQSYFILASPAYIYTIFILIAIWRSAARYKDERPSGGGWGTAAQTMVVLGWISLLGGIAQINRLYQEGLIVGA